MSSQSEPEGGPHPQLDAVLAERRRLVDLGYRLLGSVADAEDVAQEAFARWLALSEEQRDGIESPGAWLSRVTSRICLDLLGSARARRERYVGQWVPEPVPTRSEWLTGPQADAAGDPADQVTLDESVDMAFLMVLETVTPAERVSLILHDVFGYPFDEVAEIVGRSPGACRQLASSARRRIRAAEPPRGPRADQARLVRRFKQAWSAKDVAALIEVLDPNATAIADGGGVVSAEPEPVMGSERIARTVIALAEAVPDMTFLERTVNGQPGLVAQQDRVTVTVFAFGIADDRIRSIWAVRNPEKLRLWSNG